MDERRRSRPVTNADRIKNYERDIEHYKGEIEHFQSAPYSPEKTASVVSSLRQSIRDAQDEIQRLQRQ